MTVATPTSYKVRARNIVPESDNKIHDDTVAKQFGFSGALVPGVDLVAYLSHPLVDAFGLEFLSRGQLDARFRRPVYDGEEIVATADPQSDATYALALSGPDGEPRAVGVGRHAHRAEIDATRFVPTPLPASRHSTDDELPIAPLGSVDDDVTIDRHDAYLDAISESLPVYRDEQVAHPGALLRIVNELLVRNVALGPWIHTASACRFLDLARLPGRLRADALVTDCYERSGHAWVEYDALVRLNDAPVLAVHHTAIYRLASSSA